MQKKIKSMYLKWTLNLHLEFVGYHKNSEFNTEPQVQMMLIFPQIFFPAFLCQLGHRISASTRAETNKLSAVRDWSARSVIPAKLKPQIASTQPRSCFLL